MIRVGWALGPGRPGQAENSDEENFRCIALEVDVSGSSLLSVSEIAP